MSVLFAGMDPFCVKDGHSSEQCSAQQCFMQDNIIASHTFGGHSVKPVYKLSNVPDDLKWTTNTHVTPFTLTCKA